MAIKLVPFSPGTLIKSSEANGHNNLLFNNEILTKIEQLIDRDVTRSNDKVSPFVEAYINATGRNNSVVVAETSAVFKTNKYRLDFNTGTLESANFSGSDTTVASNTVDITAISTGFVSRVSFFYNTSQNHRVDIIVNNVVVASKSGTSAGNLTYTFTKSDYLFFPSAGDTVSIAVIRTSGIGVLSIRNNQSFSGTHFSMATQNVFSDNSVQNEIEFTPMTTVIDGLISHDIPAGTFKDSVSSGVVAVKIVDWEDGASLQWKATNATEDTGWQDFNIDGTTTYAKISEFTAFTSEPTSFIVKLIPKSVSPTAGVPSIAGAGVKLL